MGPQTGPAQVAQPVDSRFTKASRWGPVGWRGLPTPSATNQNGAYGDVVLTEQFKNQPGVQRISRGYNPTGWMVDSRSNLPYWQQTVTPGNVAGGQRYGSQFNPTALTPWTAAQMQGALVAAQIKQSGLANAQFTAALIAANLQAA